MKNREDIIELLGLYIISFIIVGVADITFFWDLTLPQMAGLSLVYLVGCRISNSMKPLFRSLFNRVKLVFRRKLSKA